MRKKSKIVIARIMAILMVLSILPADYLGAANVVMAEELGTSVAEEDTFDNDSGDLNNNGYLNSDGPESIGGIQEEGTDSDDASDEESKDDGDVSEEEIPDDDDSDSLPDDTKQGDNSDGLTDDTKQGDDSKETDKNDDKSDSPSDDVGTAEPSDDDTNSEVHTYIFDPETITTSGSDFQAATSFDGEKQGDGYFTVTATSSKKAAITTIAGVMTGDPEKQAFNPLTWGDYANEKLGNSDKANSERTKCIRIMGGSMTKDYASVKITTIRANAKLVVYSSPKSSGSINVKDSNCKNLVASGSSNSNPKVVKDSFKLQDAGTYYIGFSSGGGIILYMEVTEDPNATADDPVTETPSGVTLTYDKPIIKVDTSAELSFIAKEDENAATPEKVDVKNVYIKAESLAENNEAITGEIKSAVASASTKVMEGHSNTTDKAVVSYYDFSLINKDAGKEDQQLQLGGSPLRLKLAYPDTVRRMNNIIVLHNTDKIEVSADDKEADGFWIEAASFSPYIIVAEPTVIEAGKIDVFDYSGYNEGAYAKWYPFDNGGTAFSGYMAFVSKSDGTESQRVDNMLIRKYQDYYVVDALGLTPGKWTLKIMAVNVDDDGEYESIAEKEVNVTVIKHDRSGYAWVKGTSSGAYEENGSLKANANVVYITENTKDTVTLDVVTSSKGATTTCTGIQGILDGYKKGEETRPLDIRIIGNVTNAAYLDKDDIVIENSNSGNSGKAGITVEGVGEDATANGWGVRVKNASNVEIRNLGFMNRSSNGEKDNIGLQQGNDHIWVHNCDLFYGNAGSDADQIKGDGALDCKKSNYVTMSYNHFWDSGKSSLLGLSEGTNELYVTYHHNWFDHSDSRHPRIRFFTTHVYNNYYDGNAKYGVGGAKGGASIFVENNYFRNCKYPMLISMQGSDLWDEAKQQNVNANGTFSSEDGSIIKAYGNIMVGEKRFIPYSADKTETPYDESKDFDAYVASSRNETVPSSVKSKQGSHTYSNFDTASDFYKYTPDPAQNVPAVVTKGAGRVNGGDFKWTFNNSTDDESYAVDMKLKNACLNYTSKLESVGGLNGVSVNIEYTVTFNPNNGSATWTEKVQSGEKVAEPAEPSSPDPNKSFDGWYKGNAKWNFNNVVSGDMVLTALYLGEDEDPPSGGGDDDIVDDDDDELPDADTPYATPGAGVVEKGTGITLESDTAGADIYYTTDGSDPKTGDNAYLYYDGAIVINRRTTIKAYAVKSGYNPSSVATFEYIANDPSNVTITTNEFNVQHIAQEKNYTGNQNFSSETKFGTNDYFALGKGTTFQTKDSNNKEITAVPPESSSSQYSYDQYTWRMKFNGETNKDKSNRYLSFTTTGTATVTIAAYIAGNQMGQGRVIDLDGTKRDLTETPKEYVFTDVAAGTHKITAPVNDYYVLYVIVKDVVLNDEVPYVPYDAEITADPVPRDTPVEKGTQVTLSWNDNNDKLYYTTDGTDPSVDGSRRKEYTSGSSIKISKTTTIKAVAQNAAGDYSKVVTFKYTVEGSSSGSGGSWTVELDEDEYTYTGSPIKPEVTVYGYDGEELVEGVDYTVKYSNNTAASIVKSGDGYKNINEKKKPTVTISGKGIVSGKELVYFTIKPKDISNAATADDGSIAAADIMIETGKKASTPVVCYNGVKLSSKDYDYVTAKTKTYSSNDTLVIKGKGNFEGERSINVLVFSKTELKQKIKKFKVTLNKDNVKNLIYTGDNLRQSIIDCIKVAPSGSGNITSDDYVITLPDEVTDAGTVKFVVVGIGEYSGCSVSKSVKIQPRTITGKADAATDKEVVIGGVPTAPIPYVSTGTTLSDLTVTWKDGELENGKDYKLTYSGNKKGGAKAKFTIAFKGNFKGKVANQTFKVGKASLDKDNDKVGVVIADKVFKDNASIKTTAYVTMDDVLVKASEYELTYSVNGENGPYNAKTKISFSGEPSKEVFVKIKAKTKSKNYETGEDKEITCSFTAWNKAKVKADKDLSKAVVTFYNDDSAKSTKFEYTGTYVVPAGVKVTIGKTGPDVTNKCDITYVNNVNKGKASVIIKPKKTTDSENDLSGGKVATFSVVARNLNKSPLEIVGNAANAILDWFK
ncbi:MAG: chitobiase/beta-hexosaminidase C-terminal domain-containing protein [Lachnospiraceae bacterium]|nr:chitobiase/beta-hexosaminidase C-terminal domain-containing protein [Lachnospiraceae bacterium]